MAGIAMRPIDDAERAAIFRAIEKAARVHASGDPHGAAPGRLRRSGRRACRDEDAAREARRCLTCGCRKADCCLVRSLATEYGADVYRFAGARRRFSQDLSHPEVDLRAGQMHLLRRLRAHRRRGRRKARACR